MSIKFELLEILEPDEPIEPTLRETMAAFKKAARAIDKLTAEIAEFKAVFGCKKCGASGMVPIGECGIDTCDNCDGEGYVDH